MLAGSCCPTVSGMYLGCCESPPAQVSLLSVPSTNALEFSRQGWALSSRAEGLAALELEPAPSNGESDGTANPGTANGIATGSTSAGSVTSVAVGLGFAAIVVAAVGLYRLRRRASTTTKRTSTVTPPDPAMRREYSSCISQVEVPIGEVPARPSLVPPPPSTRASIASQI